MTNEIKIFENVEFGKVRVIMIDGKPWFSAKDIASALGYKNPLEAVRNYCKRGERFSHPSNGGMQKMLFIPESDVYRLIIKSKLPAAEKFETWVMEEVLPSLRETGNYSLNDNFPNLPKTFSEALRALADEVEKNEALEKEISLMKPKAEYFDKLVDAKLLTNFRDTAKEFKIGQKQFINWLISKRYIYRDKSNKLKPYMQYVPSLFEVKEWKSNSSSATGTQTMITPKGREMFRLLVESENLKALPSQKVLDFSEDV